MFEIRTNLAEIQNQVINDLNERIKSLKSEDLEMFNLAGIKLDFKLSYKVPTAEIYAYIDKVLRVATPKVFQELAAQLQENMRAGSWGWKEGVRDIVDTGALMMSQSISISEFSVDITYDSPYAAITHYGGYIYPYGNRSAAQVYLPARPWITATIEGGGPVEPFDFYASYMRAIQS